MPKRKNIAKPETEKKKQRNPITLQKKYEIINSHQTGISVKDLCARYSLSSSTVCTILKDKEKYLNEVKNAQSMQSTWLRSKKVDSLIPEMEKLLTAWIRDQTQRLHVPITYATICAEAKSIFKTLKDQKGESCKETFVASSGWFDRYKKRAGWHKIKSTNEAASTNNNDSEKLSSKTETSEAGDYLPSQNVNVGETGLLKKCLPAGNCIAIEDPSVSSFSAANNYVVPWYLHHLENHKALNDCMKNTLPFLSEANKIAWLTASLLDSGELTPEDLLEIEDCDRVDEEESDTPIRSFTVEGLEEAFEHIEKAITIFEAQDPNEERSRKVTRDLKNATVCYREIFFEKKRKVFKKSILTALFKKRDLPHPHREIVRISDEATASSKNSSEEVTHS